MLNKIKNSYLKFTNKPQPGVKSSQTLYECLFFLVNLKKSNRITQKLEAEATAVAEQICEVQLPDGGFDIGYDFLFGNGLSKSRKLEGTSPELLSVTALALYCEYFGANERVLSAIRKSQCWILERVIEVDDGIAIPYAPDTYKKVHITNATSFALSAIACSLSFAETKHQLKLRLIAEGMFKFMHKQLVPAESGAYWPYFYMGGGEDELKYTNSKVDNYHIAQQLYHHRLAANYISSLENDKTIKLVSDYLTSNIEVDGFVPYTVVGIKKSDKVDVWGYSSLLSAFSLLGLDDDRDKDKMKRCANLVYKYLMAHAWNGKFFYPIVMNSTKQPFDENFYPRSDAWVLHAISDYCYLTGNNVDQKFIQLYLHIARNNFTGLENHTLTTRKKIFAFIIPVVFKILGRS